MTLQDYVDKASQIAPTLTEQQIMDIFILVCKGEAEICPLIVPANDPQ